MQVRREGVEPLVLCSGDVLGPSLVSSITKGSHMISALNLINVHYGVLGDQSPSLLACPLRVIIVTLPCTHSGNHDFDFGIGNCATQLKASTATWLLSNVVRPGSTEPIVPGAQRKAAPRADAGDVKT